MLECFLYETLSLQILQIMVPKIKFKEKVQKVQKDLDYTVRPRGIWSFGVCFSEDVLLGMNNERKELF